MKQFWWLIAEPQRLTGQGERLLRSPCRFSRIIHRIFFRVNTCCQSIAQNCYHPNDKERKTMFTPAQVCEMLDLAPSSLRRYVALFPDLLSASAKLQTKSRRYSDQDILVLRRIKDLVRARKTPDEVRAALQVVDQDQPPASALALLPEVIQEFENLRAQLAEMQNDQQATRQELEETRARLKALEDQLSEPWYRRLFKRRPPE